MNKTIKLAAIGAAMTSIIAGGAAFAVTPAMPAEQTALLNAGYAKVADWGKFTKTASGCTTIVMVSGKNYYVSTTGKLSATLYPVRPNHVVAGADLLMTNCQG